jgi:hypothetical protein
MRMEEERNQTLELIVEHEKHNDGGQCDKLQTFELVIRYLEQKLHPHEHIKLHMLIHLCLSASGCM